MAFRKFFFAGYSVQSRAGKLIESYLARSGSQSSCAIWFILPAHGASHMFVLMLFQSSQIDMWKNVKQKHLLQFLTEIGYKIYLSGYVTWDTQSGLSIGFEVDGDILKVDGYGGRRPPKQARGLGAADAPSGVQGQSPVGGPGGEAPGSKMNLMFDIAKKLTFLICSQ